MQKILSSSIQTTSSKDSKHAPVLAKHKSEADIFKDLRARAKSQRSEEFITEIHNFQTHINDKISGSFVDPTLGYKKKPFSSTLNLKAYLK